MQLERSPTIWRVRLRPGVAADHDGETLRWRTENGVLRVGGLSRRLRAALGGLSRDGSAWGEPWRSLDARAVRGVLGQLHQRHAVSYELAVGSATARLVPYSARLEPPPLISATPDETAISRLAYARRVGHRILVASAGGLGRLELLGEGAASMLGWIFDTPAADGQRMPLAPGTDAAAALGDALRAIGVLVPARAAGEPAEPASSANWDFPDLLMHARSRRGEDSVYGAKGPRADSDKPAEAATDGVRDSLPLPRPDLAALVDRGPGFAAVIEARRSVRAFGPRRMTLDELGELLYRTFGVRPQGARAFPGAGGAWELEPYLLIMDCDGLAPGLYRYQGASHRLEPLESSHAARRTLAGDAIAAAEATDPQLLLILAARFERLNRRYRSIGYSLVLKDVGVVMQTVYLTATAMGLGACALGGGRAEAFARATGTDPLRESAVGEMLLGACG